MTVQVHSGTFKQPVANGSQAITGVGFTPTALILWSAGDFNDGSWRGSFESSFGLMSGTGAQFSCSTGRFSGGAACRNTSGTTCGTSIQGNQSVVGVATLSSFDSDGFTLSWTISGGGRYYHYLAIGGVTAKALAWDDNTSTGNQAVTGVGFKPDLVIHMCGSITSGYGTTTDAIFGMGAMSAGNQWTASFGVGTRSQRTDSCLRDLSTAAARATFVSMDSDGFTVNWATAPSSAVRTASLCLKGLQANCGSFGKSTGAATASQAVTGVGFAPLGLWLASFMRTATTSVDGGGNMQANGFAHSAAGGYGLINGGSTCNAFDKSTNVFGVANSTSQSLDAEAGLTSLDTNGFTLSWTTNDANATEILYLALAPPLAVAASPIIQAHL